MAKQIVVLATSPQKTRVMVIGEKKFHLPNMKDDWPIGKKRKAPRLCAQTLLNDALLSIPSKAVLKKCFDERVVLPSGSLCYITSSLAESVEACKRTRKHLHMADSIQFQSLEKLKSATAFDSYSPLTIEAIQTIFGTLPRS